MIIWLDNRNLNCAWVDRDGDLDVIGFQVHFPKFLANVENSEKNKDSEVFFFLFPVDFLS